MKKKFCVGIQIIEVWNITIEAESSDEAEQIASEMEASDIRAQGSIKEVDTEYAETIMEV